MSTLRLASVATLIGLAGCQTTASAPPAAESGAFVVTLGSDTLAVEQYTRVGNRIEGRLLSRIPRVAIQSYVVTLGPNGLPAMVEQQVRLPDGGLVPNAPRSATMTYTADSVIAQIQRDTMVTIRVPAAGAYPFINAAMSLHQLPIAAFNAMNRDSANFVVYSSGARQAASLPIVRKGPNKYWVYVFGSPQEVTTDDRGRVLMVDGARTTQKFIARRQASVDIPALAAMFAQRERDSRAAGPLSTRDTVNATIGAAQLWVDYGRPTARGRRVFGATGVLGDTLWRTGANAATQFRTSVPIVVAGQTIPAGTYTLWTIAVPGRYQLIFNKQIGQWGTVYDRAQDLVRVPLQTNRLGQPVERFTIVVDPTTGNAGVLRLSWDDTELAVPFTVPPPE
jgi:hypothetical protein